MKKLSTKLQLSMAFGLLVLFMLVMVALSLHSLRVANARFADYVAGAAARQELAAATRALADKRAIAVRDEVLAKTAADRESAKARAVVAHEELQKRLKSWDEAVAAATDATEDERTLIGAVNKVESSYSVVALEIVRLASADRRDEAIDKMNLECKPLLGALIGAVEEYIGYSKKQSERSVQASASAYAHQEAMLLSIGAATVVTAMFLGWIITRRLIRSLGAEPAALSAAAQRVAQGDLSPVEGAAHAPAGSVLSSMAMMQVRLVALIGQVRSSAESILAASTEIAQGNGDLSSRTESQASALQQTAASMEQLGSTARQNTESAQHASRLARDASAVALKGGDVVGQVVQTMRGINDSSSKIAEIIGVIDGIAFQTNILALNAAVEAARAGDQGRGFAVVATEVRNLAKRSTEAAKEIKRLISSSVERVEQGTLLVDQAGSTMGEIVASIDQVTKIVGEISEASVEQSAGVSQVGASVSQMDQTTQQNAALVEESAAASESLSGQARQLVESVAVFRLAGAHA